MNTHWQESGFDKNKKNIIQSNKFYSCTRLGDEGNEWDKRKGAEFYKVERY